MRVTMTVNGEQVEHDLTLDFDAISLRQAVVLEQTIGADRMAMLMADGPAAAKVAALPTTIRALLYAQLKDDYPDLAVDDVNLEIGDLVADEPEPDQADGVPPGLEMVRPDGVVVTGGGDAPDPPRAVSTTAS